MVTLLWPGDATRLSSLPRSFGRVSRWWRTTLGEWLARWRRIGAPQGRTGREGKGRDDMMTAVVQTFAWNIMKPFDFLSAFKFLFLYLYVYIYMYTCVCVYLWWPIIGVYQFIWFWKLSGCDPCVKLGQVGTWDSSIGINLLMRWVGLGSWVV